MPQFLISPEQIAGKKFTLKGPEAFHVTRVLRHRVGATLELFDGQGGRYSGVIRAILPDGTVEGDLAGLLHPPHKKYPVVIRLHLGLIKASHWEWALEKCAELGVSAFIPVITPRTVVQVKEFTGKKEERWKKILTAACKQCGRADIPAILPPVHFRDAIKEATRKDLSLVAWENHPGASTYAGLRDILREARHRHPQGLTVNLFIGPEGGFSDEEIEISEVDGAALVSLGPNTLRSETAAVAASAIVLYELGAL
ncbi:MAG: hypothetical protein A2X36_13275 [Elusimicrobia bacterium GWA2_69_24]|nr:MAG: hypothetical protein A2X36_13275 [Elusimicrobia bacterium GWA2_69_24]HBL15335.1 hypothetical protein [Elusimicrobiota bacterium]